MNDNGIGKNRAISYSFTNNAFGIFYVYTDEYPSIWNYMLDCDYVESNSNASETRCVKLANSLGSSCPSGNCYFN